MHEQFNEYLDRLQRQLQLNGRRAAEIVAELADHLESRLEELLAQGQPQDQAAQQVLSELGEHFEMVGGFNQLGSWKRRRWMMRFSALMMVGSFVAILVTLSLWPENSRFGAPDRVGAQDVGATPGGASADPFAGASGQAEQTVAKQEPNRRASDNTRNRQGVLHELRSQPLHELLDLSQFDEMPWSQLFAKLAQAHENQFRFLVDQSARDMNFDPDALPVQHRWGFDCTYEELRLALDQLDCTLVVQGRTVLVISKDVAGEAEFCQRQMIDCHELLEQIAHVERSRIGQPLSAFSHLRHWSPVAMAPGGMGGGLFQVGGGQDPAQVNNFQQGTAQVKGQPRISLGVTDESQQGGGPALGGLGPGMEMGGGLPGSADSAAGAGAGMGMGGGGGGGFGGAAGGVWPSGRDSNTVITPEYLLRETIMKTVQPDFWNEQKGTVEVVGGMLIVVASEDVLYQVENFIQDFSAALVEKD